MSDAVNDVLNVRSYKSNVPEGGTASYGITLDATPFDKLAQFTFYQNKDLWEKKNKEDAANAEKIAAVMAIDPNSTNENLYNYTNEKKNKLVELIKDGSVFDYKKNPQGYIEFHKQYGEIVNDRKKIAAFDVLNQKAREDIKDLPLEEQKAALESLETQIKEKTADPKKFLSQETNLAARTDFKPEDFQLPKATITTRQNYIILPNDNVEREAQIVDTADLYSKSKQLALGIDEFKPEDNKTGDLTIEARNKANLIAFNAKNKKVGKYSGEPLKMLNTILAQYKEKLDEYNALSEEQKANTTPPPKPEQITQIEINNAKLEARDKAVNQANIKLGLPPEQSQMIKWEDGLTKDEYIYSDGLAAAGDLIKLAKDNITHTGEANKLKINREDNAAANYRANLPYLYAKKTTTKDANGNDVVTEQQANAYDAIDENLTIATQGGKPFMRLTELPPEQAAALDKSLAAKVTTTDSEGNKVTSGDYTFTEAAKDKWVYKAPDGSIRIANATEKDGKITIDPKGELVRREGAINQSGDAIEQTTIKDRKGERSIYGKRGGSKTAAGSTMTDAEYKAWKKSKEL